MSSIPYTRYSIEKEYSDLSPKGKKIAEEQTLLTLLRDDILYCNLEWKFDISQGTAFKKIEEVLIPLIQSGDMSQAEVNALELKLMQVARQLDTALEELEDYKSDLRFIRNKVATVAYDKWTEGWMDKIKGVWAQYKTWDASR